MLVDMMEGRCNGDRNMKWQKMHECSSVSVCLNICGTVFNLGDSDVVMADRESFPLSVAVSLVEF